MRQTGRRMSRTFAVGQNRSGRWHPLMTVFLLGTVASGVPLRANPPLTEYMIVVTGRELLQGKYADGHTQFLTRTLTPLGLRCIGSMSVDDQQDDIKEALRFATEKTSLVFVTGGLGPTDSDMTRQTLSAFTGITLREHPDVLHAMERRYQKPREQLGAGTLRQTLVPSEGAYLKNPNGTAVGLVFESSNSVIVALPGPPRELQPMVREELVSYLNRRFELRPAGYSLTLRFVGIGESSIQRTLKDHVPLPQDMVPSSQFSRGRVDFTFSLPEDTPQHRRQLQAVKQQVLHHLGDYVYATDGSSLEDQVVSLLGSRGQTLAIAEVGSGGNLTSSVSAANDADSVLLGAFVAPTERLVRTMPGGSGVDDFPAQMLSAKRAESLASVAARLTRAHWSFAIGEAHEDESGSRFVHVAVRTPDGQMETQRFRLRDGDRRHARLVTQLLDHLRRQLK